MVDERMGAVRRNAHVRRRHRLVAVEDARTRRLQQRPAVGAVEADGNQPRCLDGTGKTARGVYVHPVRFRPEVRRAMAPGGHDERRRAPRRRHPHQVGTHRGAEVVFAVEPVVTRRAQCDDALAVRGPGRVREEGRVLGQPPGLTPAVGAHPPDVAAPGAPAHECQVPAIRRPGRVKGLQARGRDGLRFAALEVVHVHAGERGEGDPVAVRRDGRRFEQARLHRPHADAVRVLEAGSEPQFHRRLERDFRDFPACEIHPANTAIRREYHRLAVRRERITG